MEYSIQMPDARIHPGRVTVHPAIPSHSHPPFSLSFPSGSFRAKDRSSCRRRGEGLRCLPPSLQALGSPFTLHRQEEGRGSRTFIQGREIAAPTGPTNSKTPIHSNESILRPLDDKADLIEVSESPSGLGGVQQHAPAADGR
ncbi:hypothetical protein U9M48_006807 [Paspalum notatum var. saurae]|uniref:Uncharacterized protein n=1 Tax=Paspalum notatum var. saurae TaxID=547442 RepID=A0AAQ3Q0H8_PASNO